MPTHEATEILRIDISKAEFEKLRKNPKFVLILQLARYANQITYIWSNAPESGTRTDPETDPASSRELLNRILFSSGIMYEMLKMVPQLSREFRHFPSYQNGFAKLWKSRNTHVLKEGVLGKMRNRVVYHIDSEPIEETLSHVDFHEHVFLRVVLNDAMSAHWQLADDIAFNFITGRHDTDEDQLAMFLDVAEKLSELIVAFNESSHALMLEYAERKGWKATSLPVISPRTS